MAEAREAFTDALRIFKAVNEPTHRNLRVTDLRLGQLEREQQNHQNGAAELPAGAGLALMNVARGVS